MTHIAMHDQASTDDLFGTKPDVNALRLLRDAGCPACSSTLESERVYWFWFVNESHTNPEVLVQLAGSFGWCPGHTRAFLHASGPRIATTVLAAIVPAVHRRLTVMPSEIGRCPACLQGERAARAAITTIVSAMGDRKVRSRYIAHGGLCLPHVRQALAEVRDPEFAIVLLEALDTLLRSPSERLAAMTVPDPDAPRRNELRALSRRRIATNEPGEPARDATDALRESLRVECCSACAAAAHVEMLLLGWLPKAWALEPATLERDYAEVCMLHLIDLAALDTRLASALLRANCSRRRHEIGTCREEITPLLGLRHRPRRALRDACEPLTRIPPPCPICNATHDAEKSHLQLLEVAVGDRPTRIAFEASLGLCARHFHAMSVVAPLPVRSVIDTRLGIISWELNEASRKAAWSRRFEPEGAEQHAWRRAPALLDGRAYLGNPPPEV